MSTPVGSLVITGTLEREVYADMGIEEFAQSLATYVAAALAQNNVKLTSLCEHPDNDGQQTVHLYVGISMHPIEAVDA